MASPKSPDSYDEDNYDMDEYGNDCFAGHDEYKENADSRNITSDDDNDNDSDDGSEEGIREEFSGIKEQMYQDKLAQLKQQLLQLREGIHPEYERKLKKIEVSYKERLKMNDLWKDLELDCVEREYLADKRLVAREFEEKKADLKENLLLELEEKKKIIEQERYSLELTGDSMEYKPVSTRKLRRRGNEPVPLVEKRRKPMATSLQLMLEEREIDDDLKIINKSKLVTLKKTINSNFMSQMEASCSEPRIDNGRLHFDKKWFYKGQAVTIECKDGSRFNGELAIIGTDMVVVRKVPDNSRLKITLAQLAHGKFLVKKRI